MPDRAIIPLMPAVALGFICGLIASVTQMQTGAALAVAVCGGVIVLLAGTASVFGTKGESGEKAAVAGLRALSAVALFACIFLFMRSFLGDGSILIGLVWLVLAGVFGLLLAQLRIRDRKPLAQQRQEREEEAEREGRIYRESDEYDADADGEDADDRERSTTA